MAKKKPSRMQQALLETTRDFHRGGLAGASELDKVTMRVLGKQGVPEAPSLSGDDIRLLRERNRVSQGVLAACLGVTVGLPVASGARRGLAQPSGCAVAGHHSAQGTGRDRLDCAEKLR